MSFRLAFAPQRATPRACGSAAYACKRVFLRLFSTKLGLRPVHDWARDRLSGFGVQTAALDLHSDLREDREDQSAKTPHAQTNEELSHGRTVLNEISGG